MEYERIQLPQPYYDPVNLYRIGDTLVDTGHVHPDSRERLREELADGIFDGVERVLLTHCHIDHAGGSMSIRTLAERPHVVSRGTERVLSQYTSYLEDARQEMVDLSVRFFTDESDEGSVQEHNETYFPLDREYLEAELNVARVVEDGDTVRLGDYDCEVVHTPGHAAGHIAVYHEPSGTMLSGDVLAQNGHFPYGAVHWNIDDYKRSLERVREYDPSRLLPGHGEPMDDPRARIEDALTNVERVETAVLHTVESEGPLTAQELAVKALNATNSSVDMLTRVASVYAVHLAEQGLIDVERRPYVFARPI
jgi:glyoxylase-like metal-dependent hydrolase (beta-lactamase superfamily II)